jgi:hypothetical protein
MRIVIGGDFEELPQRLEGAVAILREIARIAEKKR